MTTDRRRVSLVVLALAFAIGSAGCGGAAPPPNAPQAEATAPYPYNVSEIRAGCPAGRVLEYKVETPGKPASVERWSFNPTTNDSVEITTTTFDVDGKPTAEPTKETDTWSALHEHARFPREATTISNESLTLPIGTVDVMRYVVKQKAKEGSGAGDEVVKTVWFARNLPGPPVKLEITKNGQPVMTMTMQANRTH